MDYMVERQTTEDGDVYPPFGVENDESGEWKKYKTSDTVVDAIYEMKANEGINTVAHVNAQVQLRSGKLKMLIDEKLAKNALMATKVGQAMTPEEREERLRPHTLTSILREEMLNLREQAEGINIRLKQANKSIGKDKFSASTEKEDWTKIFNLSLLKFTINRWRNSQALRP